jgi:hypothetical protein
MTYKNHALDEFLMGLLPFVPKQDLVRMGNMSQASVPDPLDFRASRIRIRNYLDVSGSGSFHQQAEKLRKPLLSPVLCLL